MERISDKELKSVKDGDDLDELGFSSGFLRFSDVVLNEMEAENTPENLGALLSEMSGYFYRKWMAIHSESGEKLLLSDIGNGYYTVAKRITDDEIKMLAKAVDTLILERDDFL